MLRNGFVVHSTDLHLKLYDISSNRVTTRARVHLIQFRVNPFQVHNLALYPERHSWCQSERIRQEISAHNPECKPLTIDNVVCLGACFSYSVPRAQDDAVIPPYCDACRPTKSSWTTVSSGSQPTSAAHIQSESESKSLVSSI